MSEKLKIHAMSCAAAVLAAGVLSAGVVFAADNVNRMSERYNEAGERPCIGQGSWTPIDSDNSGANLSGQISENTHFLIQCDADAWFAQGGSSAAAADGDGWLAAGAIVKLGTDASTRYISVLNKTDASADCQYVECR